MRTYGKKDISSTEVVSNNFNETILKIKLAFEKNIKYPKCDNSLFILKSYYKRKNKPDLIYLKSHFLKCENHNSRNWKITL